MAVAGILTGECDPSSSFWQQRMPSNHLLEDTLPDVSSAALRVNHAESCSPLALGMSNECLPVVAGRKHGGFFVHRKECYVNEAYVRYNCAPGNVFVINLCRQQAPLPPRLVVAAEVFTTSGAKRLPAAALAVGKDRYGSREASLLRRFVTRYFFPFIGKECAGPGGAALSHRCCGSRPRPGGPGRCRRAGAGFLLPAGAGAAALSRASCLAAPPPQPGAGRGLAAMTGR